MSSNQQLLQWSSQAKEHPGCRRVIVNRGIHPHPSAAEWEGMAIEPNGKPYDLGKGNMRLQMGTMIREGFFDS
jgi:hypothetical protein